MTKLKLKKRHKAGSHHASGKSKHHKATPRHAALDKDFPESAPLEPVERPGGEATLGDVDIEITPADITETERTTGLPDIPPETHI